MTKEEARSKAVKEVITEYLEKMKEEHYRATCYWTEHFGAFQSVSHAMNILIACRALVLLTMEEVKEMEIITWADAQRILDAMKRFERAWKAFQIEWELHGILEQLRP